MKIDPSPDDIVLITNKNSLYYNYMGTVICKSITDNYYRVRLNDGNPYIRIFNRKDFELVFTI